LLRQEPSALEETHHEPSSQVVDDDHRIGSRAKEVLAITGLDELEDDQLVFDIDGADLDSERDDKV
jgi:hypothetical protein